MRPITAAALATALLLPSLTWAELSDAQRTALQGQLADLATQVEEARRDAASYNADSIPQILATVRAETHALTAAMLEARLAADDVGADIEVKLPVVSPDPGAAATIEREIAAQEAIIAEAEAEAARTGGLMQAVALSRVQAEKLTLARLRSALMQARFGAMIPAEIADASVKNGAVAPQPETTRITQAEELPAVDLPSWADPNYPEIDYSAGVFEQLDREGFRISGWWGLLETRAEIDDSPRVYALQVEQTAKSSGFSLGNPSLQIGCNEGTLAIIYDVDEYLLTDVRRDGIDVTYRIDEEPAVTARWSETTGGEAAGLFGRQAVPFLKKLYEADRVFLRLVERNGKRHDTNFDLSGVRPVIDAAAAACGASMLDLTSDDYRAIQEMLNAAGFNAGNPDGIWGNGSKRAMRAFQEERGLQVTGAPDVATLREMGLSF